MRVEVDLAHRDADVAAGGRGDMDLAAAADGAGGDADPVGGFNAGIDVGHVSRSKGSGARTGFPDVEHRPSLRRYYPDQVRRVAAYSALNLRLRARLPGDGAIGRASCRERVGQCV